MAILSVLVFLMVIIVIIIALFTIKKSPPSESVYTEQSIQDALDDRNKIEAIKHYRYVHNVSLKEAKEAIEKMINNV